MSGENEAIVRRVYGALNTHDLEALDGCVAEDVAVHGMEAQGLAALKAEMGNYFEGVPDFRVDVEHVISGGDRVGAWIVCRGTHSGSLWGIPATGRTVAIPEIDLCRVEEGKVVEYWVLSDERTFMRQLGLAPEPESQTVR